MAPDDVTENVTDDPPPATKPKRDYIEIAATLLLALAAVATAWSSYQSARWHGEQAIATSATNATRILAVRASDLANEQTSVDVSTFEQWIGAYTHDDTELTDFYETHFRDEFKPAFHAWIATHPFSAADAPETPFVMDEYELAATDQAAELDRQAAASAEDVRDDIQRASNYVLCVVLFAVALFFGAMSTKLRGRGSRLVLLGTGWVVFLGTVGWLATFPISLAV